MITMVEKVQGGREGSRKIKIPKVLRKTKCINKYENKLVDEMRICKTRYKSGYNFEHKCKDISN